MKRTILAFAVLFVLLSCGNRSGAEAQPLYPFSAPNEAVSGKVAANRSRGDNAENVQPRWYELPRMDFRMEGEYRVDRQDRRLYYAWHTFNMAGKNYRNYTVCFDADEHAPLWVAAPRHKMYEERSTRRSDNYRPDPGIPSDVQYRSARNAGGCNKGHLLGSADRLCLAYANNQVFYYSNIAPQLSEGFNCQGGGWNILEDYVDAQVARDTLYEVIGCYYGDYTDAYGVKGREATISFGGRSDVGKPTMFYYVLLRTKDGNTGKALKDCKSSELKCAAFVRSHSNRHKGRGVTRKDLMSVSDLEKITGLQYFVNVPQAPKDKVDPSDWDL